MKTRTAFFVAILLLSKLAIAEQRMAYEGYCRYLEQVKVFSLDHDAAVLGECPSTELAFRIRRDGSWYDYYAFVEYQGRPNKDAPDAQFIITQKNGAEQDPDPIDFQANLEDPQLGSPFKFSIRTSSTESILCSGALVLKD